LNLPKDGNKIPDLSVERVRELLANERDPQAIKRLTAAREYFAGLPPDNIEDKYGWPCQTVSNWLDRFEEPEFEDALYDDERPGRPPELSDEQFHQFAETLNQSPEEAGYDEPAWLSIRAHQHLITECDVAYSWRHVQRLVKEAEVFWKNPRSEPASADEEDLERDDDELTKSRETG
jgi:transposase